MNIINERVSALRTLMKEKGIDQYLDAAKVIREKYPYANEIWRRTYATENGYPKISDCWNR